MPITVLERLKRKPVEVHAGGFVYRGILVEVTEREILLRTQTGFVSVPMERISSVVDPKSGQAKADKKFIDSSFYDSDPTTSDK